MYIYIYIKYKVIKIQNLQKYEILIMELIHNTKYKFDFLSFSIFLIFYPTSRKRFGIVGYFVKESVVLDIGFGFVVLNSIW